MVELHPASANPHPPDPALGRCDMMRRYENIRHLRFAMNIKQKCCYHTYSIIYAYKYGECSVDFTIAKLDFHLSESHMTTSPRCAYLPIATKDLRPPTASKQYLASAGLDVQGKSPPWGAPYR